MVYKKDYKHLTFFWRYFLYGVFGIFTEVIYTSIFDIIAIGNVKLVGVSSTWAFFIYATCLVLIEKMSVKLKRQNVPLLLRAFVYLFLNYFWEFSTGYILSLFDACPWNYEGVFDWHFMGLVTLEYSPLWYAGSILAEKFIIPRVNRLVLLNQKLEK
jgi:uncharacterized membrane protein